MIYTNAESVSKTCPEFQSRTIDVGPMANTETCFRLGEGGNKPVSRGCTIFRMGKEGGRMAGGSPVLLAEKADARYSHKRNTPYLHVLEVKIANGGSWTVSVSVYWMNASGGQGTVSVVGRSHLKILMMDIITT